LVRQFFAALLATAALAPAPAHAVLQLLFSNSGAPSIVDIGFENVGGWLSTTYGLGKADPSCISNCTVLPQVERAVGQIAGNNAIGLFIPSGSSGFPPTQALTNFGVTSTVSGGSFAVPGSLAQNTAVPFSYARSGNVMTYTLGGSNPRVWTSPSLSYFGALDTIELRARSAATDAINTPTTVFEIGNLVYSDMAVSGQSLNAVGASNGNVAIAVFGGVVGNFTLTGTYRLDWTGSARPTGWNSQIKGLDLPSPVTIPEPGTLALLGAAGLLLALRRRR